MRQPHLVGTLAAAVLAVCGGPILTDAADHADAPAVRGARAQTDLNDVYMFRSPQTPDNVVLISTMSPLAGITGPNFFDPNADYDFLIDIDGDARADARFRSAFSAPGEANVQQTRLQFEKGDGTQIFDVNGFTGQTIELPNGGLLRAGLFDDPFFFNLLEFRNSLQFTAAGSNFFRGVNTLGIVIEVPSAIFGTRNIGGWGRTTRDGQQVDRNGRPAINTVLIPAARKNEFNQTTPVLDQLLFREPVIATLMALGNSAARANSLADFLLPDIMTIDTSSAAGFPNGRRLQDDVIDIELNLLSNGAVTSDRVGNDSTFLQVFPYLAPPNP